MSYVKTDTKITHMPTTKAMKQKKEMGKREKKVQTCLLFIIISLMKKK